MILLNNDIRVRNDFIDPLVKKIMGDPSVFLAAPRIMNFDGSGIDAVDTRAGFRCGMLEVSARYPGYEAQAFPESCAG